MSDNDSLFPEYQLLSWLPDETFFSLISRHHSLWGHTTPAQTCRLLFGSMRAGSHHDLPNCLGHFVQRTNALLGDARSIAKERTLLKFYGAFAVPDETENAIACMSGSSVAHLKLRLGILTSRFRANHPLKACAQCMEQDLRETGWAYWHLTHQFPGVWVCTAHKQPLLQSILKTNGVERFHWALPHLRGLTPTIAGSSAGASPPALAVFAELIESLVRTGKHLPLLRERLHGIYRPELLRRGWLTAGGNLRTAQIAQAFLCHCQPLRQIPEVAALPEDPAGMEVQLGRLLRPPRSGTHPLRHLLFIHWLFGDARHFERAMGDSGTVSTGGRQHGVQPVSPADDPRKDQLCSLIRKHGHSLRKAASLVGVDTQTALVWAASSGIDVPRRPQKLTEDVRVKAIRDLRKGADKSRVATRAGVSVETITRLLLSDAQLHADWLSARSAKCRAQCRAEWLQLLQTCESLGVKWMRQMEPRTYAWLYRNDRAWLDAHKPAAVPVSKRPRPSVVDWDARDERLSALVRDAGFRLMHEQGVRQIKFWQLCQLIPDLRAKQASLHRMPRTLDAVRTAMAAHLPSQDLFR